MHRHPLMNLRRPCANKTRQTIEYHSRQDINLCFGLLCMQFVWGGLDRSTEYSIQLPSDIMLELMPCVLCRICSSYILHSQFQ